MVDHSQGGQGGQVGRFDKDRRRMERKRKTDEDADSEEDPARGSRVGEDEAAAA